MGLVRSNKSKKKKPVVDCKVTVPEVTDTLARNVPAATSTSTSFRTVMVKTASSTAMRGPTGSSSTGPSFTEVIVIVLVLRSVKHQGNRPKSSTLSKCQHQNNLAEISEWLKPC